MKKAILAVFLLVAIVVAPSLHRFYRTARVRSSQPCWPKLMNIAAAKDQWALERGATSGTPVMVESILPYLGTMPTCHVAGATYNIGKTGEEPSCTVHGTISQFKPDRY